MLSIDRISADQSPIIKLVDSTLFNAIQRRASDIHIETREHEVVIKYRIDGVLYQAMEPIDRRHHQTIVSRIKVMSELDIAEKRIPQDGASRCVSAAARSTSGSPSCRRFTARTASIRILDKESMNQEFKNLRLDVLGLDSHTISKLRKFIREPYAWCWSPGPPAPARRRRSTPAVRDPVQRGQDHHDRGSGRVPARRNHPDPGQREEGADLRPRVALHPPPRSGQDHGRRDSRRGDGADCHPVRAHRPSRVHDRPREQRRRRAGTVPQHERRPLQLRGGAELRTCPTIGAAYLQPLPRTGRGDRGPARGERSPPRGRHRLATLRRHRLHGVQRDRLLRRMRCPSCSTCPIPSANSSSTGARRPKSGAQLPKKA